MSMSKARGVLGSLIVATAMAACSTDPTGTAPNQLLYDVFSNGVSTPGDGGEAKDITQLTRAAISDVDFPLLLVSIPETGAASTVTIAAPKGQIVTWVSVDRVGVTFDGPVLFGTRGIGPDLLTAETETLKQLLSGRNAGTLTRRYRHLNGLDQIEITTFECQLVSSGSETITVLERNHSTQKMQENCQTDDGLTIENMYWIGSDDTLWKSQQWVSLQTGYLVTERLVK